jgi:hypothetical protein
MQMMSKVKDESKKDPIFCNLRLPVYRRAALGVARTALTKIPSRKESLLVQLLGVFAFRASHVVVQLRVSRLEVWYVWGGRDDHTVPLDAIGGEVMQMSGVLYAIRRYRNQSNNVLI